MLNTETLMVAIFKNYEYGGRTKLILAKYYNDIVIACVVMLCLHMYVFVITDDVDILGSSDTEPDDQSSIRSSSSDSGCILDPGRNMEEFL